MNEPKIMINGRLCTDAQAMVIRVAIESFASSLAEEGLGEDPHGKAMTGLYQQRIAEVRALMHNPSLAESMAEFAREILGPGRTP